MFLHGAGSAAHNLVVYWHIISPFNWRTVFGGSPLHSVLIRGETGTGKGLLARYIREQSSRQDQPFVAVNCATIGPSLAESELFGHVKGSFTGASRDRIGKFRSAEGGTVFLDEISDLPLEIQPKLLRALEAKTLVPVGADKELKVPVDSQGNGGYRAGSAGQR